MFSHFIVFIMIGFGAQLIDGALGMAYGTISMATLLSMGILPAAASASVHTAEIFTTGISGLSHAVFKNINRNLFFRLAIPGMIGSVIGAFLLTKMPINIIRPIIAVYLLVMGLFILYKAIRKTQAFAKVRALIPLGFLGGFLDAAGGGGWGSIVTSSLLVQGIPPRYTIGTTNLAEFLVTLSSAATFFMTIGVKHWSIILGLIIGGVIAAPIAAYAVRFVRPRLLMLLVGILIIAMSVRTLITIKI